VPAFDLLEIRVEGVVCSYGPPLASWWLIRGAALGSSVSWLHSTGRVVLSLLLSGIISVLCSLHRQGLNITFTKLIFELHRSIIDIGTLDVKVLAQIDLRNGHHIIWSTFVIVPGASFGMLCEVELEVILYYLAKAFVFVCFDIVVSSLKRFGVQSLVAIESAVCVLG
jgi:hypothetical protein